MRLQLGCELLQQVQLCDVVVSLILNGQGKGRERKGDIGCWVGHVSIQHEKTNTVS